MSQVTKGIVFDLQRCSLQDGPGIRTTVFLKGCPLRCIWCHNPESQSGAPQLYYNAMRCTQCGGCVAVCPNRCHTVVDRRHIIDRIACKVCGKCVDACTAAAVEIKGREMSLDEVMSLVMADSMYYRNSGGGITVTGGEPMYQFGFLKTLLKRCKSVNIHTCMETCGFAPVEHYREIQPLTDLFLFDYKATGQVHKELTGADQVLILANLEMLLGMGADVILRCPMIPGVNDSEEHLAAIAELERRYPTILGIEVMAYHNMGVAKAERVGRRAQLEMLPNVSEKQKSIWLERLHCFGSTKAIIS